MRLDENGNSRIDKIKLSYLYKNTKTPDCQRDLSNDRVNEIINNVSIKPEIVHRMSPIIICELDNDWFIIDGQHRYSAFVKLKLELITVQIIKVNSDDELKELFVEINQNTPLPLNWLNLPTHQKRQHKKLLKNIREMWGNVLSDANKPRQPQIKKKDFEDILISSPLVTFEHIVQLNDIFKKLTSDKSKFERKDFYLSQSKNLKDDINRLLNGKEVVMGFGDAKKKKIPKTLKTEVWRNEFGSLSIGESKCTIDICKTLINLADYDCGHVISESNGGATNLTNLRPICHSCNCSMGSKNWDDFLKLIN